MNKVLLFVAHNSKSIIFINTKKTDKTRKTLKKQIKDKKGIKKTQTETET